MPSINTRHYLSKKKKQPLTDHGFGLDIPAEFCLNLKGTQAYITETDSIIHRVEEESGLQAADERLRLLAEKKGAAYESLIRPPTIEGEPAIAFIKLRKGDLDKFVPNAPYELKIKLSGITVVDETSKAYPMVRIVKFTQEEASGSEDIDF